MKRFKNILFYTDESSLGDNAFSHALRLAKSNHARLTVMDVIPNAELADEVQKRHDIDLNRLLVQKRRAEIEKLLKPYQTDDLSIDVIVTSGTPLIELIRSVQKEGYDLLIKEANSTEVLREYLFGSFDMHLFRKCPCPVWIDRVHEAGHYKNIIAAVDPDNPENSDLNKLIMDLATSLAERESALLHVVHAWNIEEEKFLTTGRTLISATELRILTSSKEERHRKALNSMLKAYPLDEDSYQTHLIKDTPAKAISTLARSLNADLIVMGTVGKNRVPGIIIGNTAEDVLQSTRTSVLAVKPDDFVSPVTA
ncbi:MAG: universal stress protein [Gammaproteobacteria bacterium]|nr:universal stress protein [Gammaproteobacteria bacterium]